MITDHMRNCWLAMIWGTLVAATAMTVPAIHRIATALELANQRVVALQAEPGFQILKEVKPLDKQHNQTVLRMLHNKEGMEMTEEELIHHRTEAFKKIRAFMKKAGWDLPEDDVEMLQIIQAMMNRRGK